VKFHRVVQTPRGVVEFIEDEIADPCPSEVRLKIQAAGVSFADILMREGIHPEARRKPFTPGWDVIGVVEKLGDGVSSVKVGDTVAALPIVGGYAEYVCLPESELVAVPAHVAPAEAVCMVLNYTTAYQMLHRSVEARPGECALIHSAAGGVGSALLQLCKLHGVTTFGTASRRKLETVEMLGGIPIDYQLADFVKRIRDVTENGVDIVFDGIGGWNLRRSYKVLKHNGRLVAYGLQSSLIKGKRNIGRVASDAAGWATVFALNLMKPKKRFLLYSIQMLKRRHPDWFREDLMLLFDLLARGEIKPIVAEALPMEQAALAHERLSSRSVIGKIVLLCGTD
jgi:NADPH2:quinone reductase